MFALVEGDVTLYDANGNAIASVNDGGTYRLATSAKIRNVAGTQINPATQDTLAEIDSVLDSIKDTAGIKKITDPLPAGTNNIGDVDVLSSALPTGAATEATLVTIDAVLDEIESILDAIKDTDGIKKITDPLPAGTNEIGRVRGFLYDDVNNVAMAVAPEVAIPTNTRALLWAGEGADGKAYVPRVSDEGKVSVASSPPAAPPGTTEFVLAGDTPLEVGPSPSFDETESATIGNGVDLKLQFFAGGAAGDPSEKGSKVEIYWREGAGPTDHLIERLYVSGSTVYESLPDTNSARDGTPLTGNGTNTKLVIRRERLSTSAQEIDAVVRGYTES